MQEIKCIICENKDTELLYNRGVFKRGEKIVKFNNVICKTCGLVYINPRIKPGEIERFSNKKYLESCFSLGSEEKIEEYIERIEKKSKKVNFNFLKKYLTPQSSVLDIGCGFGFLLKDIKEGAACHVEGIEPASSGRHASLKFGLKIFNGAFEEFFEKYNSKKKFDLVLMNHVFEHFPNPIETLNKIKLLLKNDGLLYIEVPNILNFERRVKYFFDFWHYYNYSPLTLSKVLEKGGFKIIERNPEKPSRIQIIAAQNNSPEAAFGFKEKNSYKKIKNYIRKRIITDPLYRIFLKLSK